MNWKDRLNWGLILAVMFVLVSGATSRATSFSRGPFPGFVSQVTYTGIPAPGAILALTCRFSLPPDSLGAKQHASQMKELLLNPDLNSLKWENEFIDSVFWGADTNIEILGPLSWKGRIEPGQEYVFTTTIRLKREFISQGYFGAATRYGNQPLGRLAFFTDKLRIPIGYVTDVVVDSLGNYWHSHRAVVDANLEGFIPFDSGNGLPPDTSFDKTGKILLVLQVGINIKPHGLPIKLGPGLKQFQQKPTGKNSKDDSVGKLNDESSHETVASRLQRITSNEGEGTLYTITGTYQYQHAITSQFEPIPLATIQVYYLDFFQDWVFQFSKTLVDAL